LQSLAPTPVSRRVDVKNAPVVKIIAESLSQHDEKHIIPNPVSGIRVGKRKKSQVKGVLLSMYCDELEMRERVAEGSRGAGRARRCVPLKPNFNFPKLLVVVCDNRATTSQLRRVLNLLSHLGDYATSWRSVYNTLLNERTFCCRLMLKTFCNAKI
jgi:hypothetical protein